MFFGGVCGGSGGGVTSGDGDSSKTSATFHYEHVARSRKTIKLDTNPINSLSS